MDSTKTDLCILWEWQDFFLPVVDGGVGGWVQEQVSTSRFSFHNTNQMADTEKFLSNILDDLESRFSQQMLIEFFLCAKCQNNTQSWHWSGSQPGREEGRNVNSNTVWKA